MPGIVDLLVEPQVGVPQAQINLNRQAMARYGINTSQVLNAVEVMGGKVVGQILEGQQRFFLQVGFRPEDRSDIARIRTIPVADPGGAAFPWAS